MVMSRWLAVPCALVLAATVANAAPTRELRMRAVDVKGALPPDLLDPEGKSRWRLDTVALSTPATVTMTSQDGRLAVETAKQGSTTTIAYEGADRERWLLPDRDPSQMKMGARVTLALTERRDGLVDELLAQVATVGIGWVHLPSGAHEAVLQRALVLRRKAGERGFRPDAIVHRWVDPLAGIVAEISGPASSDGGRRTMIESASVAEEVVLGAADLKIYSDQMERGSYVDVLYGWDKGSGTTVPSLVPNPGIANMCDLVNLPSWDFSANNTGTQETASTTSPINVNETCNNDECGYTIPAAVLGREDRNITGTLRKDNQSTERENRPTDVTIWLRAGTQNEDKMGIFGTGESRFCHANFGGKNRQPVPLWRFSHQDAQGWYLQAGDTWESVPLNQTGSPPPDCQETFYTTKCGVPQFLTPNPLYAHACTTSGQTHLGKQSTQMVKGGVVTLPSGHTLNALVTRNTADYCVYTGNTCGAPSDRVRTVIYYWQVPYLGSVVLLRSVQHVDFTSAEISAGATTPCTNYTTVDFTDFAYGLFPPVSITAGTATDTSVQLSWNPGNDVHRISGYKIYWDTDSGSATPYAFNSVSNAGQVSIVGTTATISGLTPGTTYYFTVTSLSSYTDPQSTITTSYESIKYPTVVSGDPSFSYPVEVQKQTTGGACIPTQEITGLTVDKASPNVHVCWNATSDACAVGYDVLGSNTATSAAGYTVVGQVGLTTCWDGNPSQTYLIVRSRGTGGNGPWGHYGQ